MNPTSDNPAPNDLPAFKLLQKSNKRLETVALADLLRQDRRFENFSRTVDGLLYDFSRTRLDEQGLAELLQLARERGLAARRDALFAGEPVNHTENRPVMHMALRSDELLATMGEDEFRRYSSSRERMLSIADELFAGRLPGVPGEAISDVVHVGIGGSLLGPRLVGEALDEGRSAVRVHFLGSVDAGPRERLLRSLDPRRTVVVLVSKSFTTGDTLLHGRRLRGWLQDALGEDGARRLFAVTSHPGRAGQFGVESGRVLYFPEWVGGRYSLWAPVSLAAAAQIGSRRFRELLGGAECMDRHFREAPLADNLPALFGLVGVWHRNLRQHAAWGVFPYDQRLRLLPAYLQQLVMESNGKSVRQGGQRSELGTSPVVFGETGTEAQHSVFQAMHQGSDIVPLDFVAVVRPGHDDREAHDELLANLLAQLTALAAGRSAAATRADLGEDNELLLAHRTFEGNRPGDLLLLDELTPFSLGLLLALYEHKVFVESVIWDINAFDQWGVELGKTLIPAIQEALGEDRADEPGLEALLGYIRDRR